MVMSLILHYPLFGLLICVQFDSLMAPSSMEPILLLILPNARRLFPRCSSDTAWFPILEIRWLYWVLV